MNEITLPTDAVFVLIGISSLLTIYLWRHLGTYQLHTEPKKSSEGNLYSSTPQLTNDLYGAYIQLAGRRYN